MPGFVSPSMLKINVSLSCSVTVRIHFYIQPATGKNILLFTFNVKKYSAVCRYNTVCAILSQDKQYLSLLLGLQGLETNSCGFVLMVIEEFGSFGGAFERSTGQARKK